MDRRRAAAWPAASIYTQDGRLAVSVVQEGLLRVPRAGA